MVEGVAEVPMTTIVTNAIIVDQTEVTTNIQIQGVATSKDTVVNSDHLHVTALVHAQAPLHPANNHLRKTTEKGEAAREELAEVVVITDALTPGPTLTTIITIRTGMIHSVVENHLHTVAAGSMVVAGASTTCSRLIEVAITAVAGLGGTAAEADINTTISMMTRSGSAKATIITQIIQTTWVEVVPAIQITFVLLVATIDTLKSVQGSIRPQVDAHLLNNSVVVHPPTQRSLQNPLDNTATEIKTKRLLSRHRL